MQSFIQRMKQEYFQLVGCEILYNLYGDRGSIDVVLRKDFHKDHTVVWWICELKPILYDIGETIRQVRRAQSYFHPARPDLAIPDWKNRYRFLLVLGAENENLRQLQQYADLFVGIDLMFHHEVVGQIQPIKNQYEIQQAVLAVQGSAPIVHFE